MVKIFKENRKMTLLGVFGVVFFAAVFWLVQPAPKAEACGAECIKDGGVCKSDDTTWGTDHDTCTINIGLDFYNTASGTSVCSSGSGASRKECLQDACPDLSAYAPLNGASCAIMTGNSGWTGCIDPKIKATGIWDASKSKCIVCLGNKEFSVCGNTSSLVGMVNSSGNCVGVDSDTDKFETACSASVTACDEKSPGDSCSPPTGGTCDANGQCIAAAICTYNNPTVTLNPASITGSKGSSKTFTISITNNNTAACANETFTLTGSVPGGWTNSINPTNSVTLASGGVMTRDFIVNSSSSAAPGSYSVSVSATGNLGGKTAVGPGTFVISAGGYASFKDGSTWYSLKSDLTRTTCSSVCSGAAPPNSSCSNVGACQTGFGGSAAACITYATCANDQEACKCPAAPEICNNQTDDNGNLLVDCADVGFCPQGSICGAGKTCNAAGTCVVSGGGGPVSSPLCQFALIASDAGKLCGTHTVIVGEVGGWCCSASNFVAADKPTCQSVDPACAGAAPPPGPVCGNNIKEGTEACDATASPTGCTGSDVCNASCTACVPPPPSAGPCGSGSGTYRSPLSYCSIQELIQGATGWVLGLVSSIIILFLVYGGIMYTMAAGDETKMESAKNIIYYAILGLAIILVSYTLITEVKTILKIP